MHQFKQFYEIDALRHNIWQADRKSNLYFQEMLRYKKILDLITIDHGKILDLGAGDGYLSWLLAKKGYQVSSIDISLNRLQKFGKQAQQSNIERILGDVKLLPFDDNSLDCVVASELLEHLPNYQDVICEVYRVLRPSGTFIISVPYREQITLYTCPYCLNRFHPVGHYNSFNEENLASILTASGFEIEHQVLFSSKLTSLIQKFLKLSFSRFVTTLDFLISKLFPDRSIYLAARASKRL